MNVLDPSSGMAATFAFSAAKFTASSSKEYTLSNFPPVRAAKSRTVSPS